MTGSYPVDTLSGGREKQGTRDVTYRGYRRENIRGCQNVRYALMATNFGFAAK